MINGVVCIDGDGLLYPEHKPFNPRPGIDEGFNVLSSLYLRPVLTTAGDLNHAMRMAKQFQIIPNFIEVNMIFPAECGIVDIKAGNTNDLVLGKKYDLVANHFNIAPLSATHTLTCIGNTLNDFPIGDLDIVFIYCPNYNVPFKSIALIIQLIWDMSKEIIENGSFHTGFLILKGYSQTIEWDGYNVHLELMPRENGKLRPVIKIQ